MTNICELLDRITAQEEKLRSTQFLAPCLRGGRVRTRLSGIVYTFIPKPRQFEGWGIFQPVDEQTAIAIAAELPQVAEYLRQFKLFRLRLAYVLKDRTWLAYPTNEADVRQRLGIVKPVPVHLVTDGASFEQVLARWDGCSWWFEELDRRADPLIVEELQTALSQQTLSEEVRFKGMTAQMRTVYDLVAQHQGFSQHQRNEERLQQALQLGGGELRQFHERGEYWTVEWMTADGELHSSAIAKTDLTVISSGICLSDRDRDFDLQSLVGVFKNRH